jgi:hypothetical protein
VIEVRALQILTSTKTSTVLLSHHSCAPSILPDSCFRLSCNPPPSIFACSPFLYNLSTMPSLPLRIAILECDTPLDNTRAKYGSYGGVFAALLNAGVEALETPPLSPLDLKISTFDVVAKQEYPSLKDIDAILITGSRHNSFDNDPWILKLVAFTEDILKQRRVRIIGVCFGHQIAGRALGAKVDRSDKGWEISVTAIDLTKKGQEIFGKTALVNFYLIPFYFEPFD